MSLRIRIVTPEREVSDENAPALTAEGTLGQFGILPQHISFLSELEPGWLEYTAEGGGARRFAIKGGYAEVTDDVVTILADEAVASTDIDRGAAEEARRIAEGALDEAPFGHPDHDRARGDLRWAEVQLEQ